MDDEFDTETEKLLPNKETKQSDEDSGDEYTRTKIHPRDLSSSDYDEDEYADDDDDDDDDDNNDMGDEDEALLDNDTDKSYASSNKENRAIKSQATSNNSKEITSVNSQNKSNENVANETIEGLKEINNVSKCHLRDESVVYDESELTANVLTRNEKLFDRNQIQLRRQSSHIASEKGDVPLKRYSSSTDYFPDLNSSEFEALQQQSGENQKADDLLMCLTGTDSKTEVSNLEAMSSKEYLFDDCNDEAVKNNKSTINDFSAINPHQSPKAIEAKLNDCAYRINSPSFELISTEDMKQRQLSQLKDEFQDFIDIKNDSMSECLKSSENDDEKQLSERVIEESSCHESQHNPLYNVQSPKGPSEFYNTPNKVEVELYDIDTRVDSSSFGLISTSNMEQFPLLHLEEEFQACIGITNVATTKLDTMKSVECSEYSNESSSKFTTIPNEMKQGLNAKTSVGLISIEGVEQHQLSLSLDEFQTHMGVINDCIAELSTIECVKYCGNANENKLSKSSTAESLLNPSRFASLNNTQIRKVSLGKSNECFLEKYESEIGGAKPKLPDCKQNSQPSMEFRHSADDIFECNRLQQQQKCHSDVESRYFEKSDSSFSQKDALVSDTASEPHLLYDQTVSESLRNQLNRFDLLIDTIGQRNAINIATNAAERGYWSTIFGQASEIEAYDEMSPERKAHRALELLEDYHSRLSEPQDRALRIAIERVIRIFKSRLFQALLARDFMQAYKHQSHCIQSVVKMLQQLKEENWCLPVMYTVCLDLRILAQRCEELGNSSKPGEILEKAADCLMSCFRVCAADNRSSDNETKRLGMLHLVNQLFKVYFRINKLHLCKPLIRAIDSSAFKDLFPLPERITYKYFVGRKAMFDSDYKSADEFLSFAFKHCPKNFPRNKRLILIYLVPVKMLLGFLPKKCILERYDVLQFHELAEALKEGNVRKFDDVIQRHEIFFIKCGIYLLVEKLKFIVYRNLFKKVYIIKQTHQLDLNAFRSALQFVGESDMTIDETHCIVANLIFEGKIKGYISHSHNKLVVSKQNPFPPLNTVS